MAHRHSQPVTSASLLTSGICFGGKLRDCRRPSRAWLGSYTNPPLFFLTFYFEIIVKSQEFSREGNGNPLQYSCLETPMDRGAWLAAVHGVVKSRTRLSDFTFTFHFHALEKEMATHSSVLAWKIPGTGEPGGLPSMGLHRVGHD